MPASSFYTDGETYDTAEVTSNDQPGSTSPSQAPSSFYPEGNIYDALAEETATVATMEALLASTQAAAADAASHDASAASHDSSSAAHDASAASSASTATTQAGIATTQASNAASSASAALASQGAAATSASNASTSEANALSSKNAAATSASNASTSEANALSSKNAAATSATNAATSESNALASKNAAATSATNAATSASNASTSATNAATSEANALSYKNAASTSATNAATSESNALSYKNAANTSATNAATSESNALSYKNSASTSATNAATSETNSLNYLKSFRDVYYGSLTSDPSTDPDGNTPNAGDFYFNSVSVKFRSYSGTGWVDLVGSGGGNLTATYLLKTADATLTNARVVNDSTTVTWDWTVSGQVSASVANVLRYDTAQTLTAANQRQARQNIGAYVAPMGRLTLLSGSGVMPTTQSAKTTLYYTPYIGNQVPIYDGTSFAMWAFSELSVATTDTTKSPAAIGASKINDWFLWNDGGTLRLGHGPDWTNATTRSAGTALVNVNGVWLNNAAITNGPAAQRGTYVGTTLSNASSQLDWILGGSATGGVAGFLGVWNAYNRRPVTARTVDTGAGYTYNGTTRQARGSAGMQTTIVVGLAEDAVAASWQLFVSMSAINANATIYIGYDSTTVQSSTSQYFYAESGNGPVESRSSWFSTTPTIGSHFIAALERAGASVTLNGTTDGQLDVMWWA